MNDEQMIKIIGQWIDALEPKGNVAINASNVKGFKMDNVQIKGFKTGVELGGSSDIDFKNVEISSGDSKILIELLNEFRTLLQGTPKEKGKRTDIFDKIYSTCGSIQGMSPIIETLSKFVGLG